MELLLSAIVTCLTQLFKWFAEEIGVEKAKMWTLIVAFGLSVAGTFGWQSYVGQINWQDTKEIVSVFGLAIGYYEVIIKRIINPIINEK